MLSISDASGNSIRVKLTHQNAAYAQNKRSLDVSNSEDAEGTCTADICPRNKIHIEYKQDYLHYMYISFALGFIAIAKGNEYLL